MSIREKRQELAKIKQRIKVTNHIPTESQSIPYIIYSFRVILKQYRGISVIGSDLLKNAEPFKNVRLRLATFTITP